MPYHAGYSVAPRLTRIARDAVFAAPDGDTLELLAAKRDVPPQQIVQVEADCPPALIQAAVQFIRDFAPGPLPDSDDLFTLAAALPEDVVLHALDNTRDWFAWGAVWLPSGWRPEAKVGRSFAEIHEPVPGMELGRSRELVRAMIHKGPFERFVWSVLHERRWNGHPDQPRAEFQPAAARAVVKVERQTLVGFPEQSGALFLIRQSLVPDAALDRPALARALRGMTPAEHAYKRTTSQRDALLRWLEDAHGEIPG